MKDKAIKYAIFGAVALGAYALCAFVQRRVIAVPIVGDYLPK